MIQAEAIRFFTAAFGLNCKTRLWLKAYHTQVLLVCVFVFETKAERKRDKPVSQYVLKNYIRQKKLLQKQTSLCPPHQICANAFCKNMKK